MRSAILLLAFTTSLAAQESILFPRFSVIGGSSASSFDTNARIDPETSADTGTLVAFENDLGLEDSATLERFSVQWRPFARHELAGTFFSAPRSGQEQIDREIIFRNETYRAQALVTTQWDLDYASLTYTYWLRRGDRDGLGLTLGAATLALDASVTAERDDESLTVTQEANTDVPVGLVGVQGRVAFGSRFLGEASVATLPRVTIEDYTGSALTGTARLEYRPVRWLGIGVAYNYFRLDVDVEQLDLRGALDMTIRGPEGYLRLAF
jgi:hypothetical protein